jgi:hypothetical protein
MNPQNRVSLADMTDEQFGAHAQEILQRELGADGYARFLRIAQTGSGNFTRDRRKWEKGITVLQIAEKIAKLKEHSVWVPPTPPQPPQP